MKVGIDVSKWQGDIIWEEASGRIDFAIVKIDENLKKNVEGRKKNKIPIGVYYFLPKKIAGKEKKIISEIVTATEDIGLDLPVYLDIEYQERSDREATTKAIVRIGDSLEKKSYTVGTYFNTSDRVTLVKTTELARFTHWHADWRSYGEKGFMGLSTRISQISNKGVVKGISTFVDMNLINDDDFRILIERYGKKNG